MITVFFLFIFRCNILWTVSVFEHIAAPFWDNIRKIRITNTNLTCIDYLLLKLWLFLTLQNYHIFISEPNYGSKGIITWCTVKQISSKYYASINSFTVHNFLIQQFFNAEISTIIKRSRYISSFRGSTLWSNKSSHTDGRHRFL